MAVKALVVLAFTALAASSLSLGGSSASPVWIWVWFFLSGHSLLQCLVFLQLKHCSGMTPRYVALRLEKQKMSELLIDTSQAQRGDKSHATPQTIVEGALTMVPLYRGLSGRVHTRETMGIKRTS